MSSLKLRKNALVVALAVGALTGSATWSTPAAAHSRPAPVGTSDVAGGLGLDPIGDVAASALRLLDANGAAAAEYVAERDMLAAAVADRVGLDSATMQFAWAHADPAHQRALLAGLTQIGVRYRKNTSKEGVGFDCSGLTAYAWVRAGVEIPHQSASQIRQAASRTIHTAQAGDLVYYPGHVSMWLGVGKGILHSPQPGHRVEVKVQSGNKSLRFGDPSR